MIADGLTLDQVQLFLTVADTGSFSAAARATGRAQSAVTYAIQRLEDQLGAQLFDRGRYRPTLTEAGRALLPRARRIAEDVGAFKLQARALAGGLEPELPLVVDAMFPMDRLVCALADFQSEFPSVQPRIYAASLGATVQHVLDRRCVLGLALGFGDDSDLLGRAPVTRVRLIPVAAPAHPLAQLNRALSPEDARGHVQLVLTDSSALTTGKDHGVYSTQTWRLSDLSAKHTLLLAGLGWGTMPEHMISDDLAAGRLVRLEAREWDDIRGTVEISAKVVWRLDVPLGPAASWMKDRIVRGD